MGENAKILAESACNTCSHAFRFVIGNGNMWWVVCNKYKKDMKPRDTCKNYLEEV